MKHQRSNFGPLLQRALLPTLVIAVSCLARAQQNFSIQWLNGSIQTPSYVAYSANGAYVVVGGNGPTQVYTVATGAVRYLPALSVSAVSVSPDGQTIAVLDVNPYFGIADIQLWNTDSLRLTGTIQLSNSAYAGCIAFTPDAKSLVVGGQDSKLSGLLTIFDLSTKKATKMISTGGEGVISLSLSKDGKELADVERIVPGDKVDVWNLRSGKLLQTFKPSNTNYQPVISLSPDGSAVAMGAYDSLQTWSVASGKQLNTFNLGSDYTIDAVSFSADGQSIADCGGSPGIIQVWNASTGAQIATIPTTASGSVNAVAFSPDGKSLVDAGDSPANAYSGVGSPLEFWSLTSKKLIATFDTSPISITTPLAYSQDGQYVAAGGNWTVNGVTNKALTVWDAANGKPVAVFATTLNNAVNSLAFSPDGKRIALGGTGGTNDSLGPAEVEVWDVLAGKKLTTLTLSSEGFVNKVLFTPDGSSIVATGFPKGNDPALEFWNASTFEPIGSYFPGSGISCAAISPDGKSLILGGGAPGGGPLQQFDIASGTITASFATQSTSGIDVVQFSPDGKSFAAGGQGMVEEPPPFGSVPCSYLELWNIASTTPGSVVVGGGIFQTADAFAFSPDGKVLFANSKVGTNAISTSDHGLVWATQSGPPNSIAVSPSGAQVSFVIEGGTVVAAQNPLYDAAFITGFSLAANTITSGASTTGTVTLSRPAPKGGTRVNVIGDGKIATMPTSFIIPAGSINGSFKIRAANLTKEAIDDLTVTVSSGSLKAELTVKPPA